MDSEVRRLGRALEAEPSRENLERLDSARRRAGDGPWLPVHVVTITGWTFDSWPEQWSTIQYWISRSFGFALLPPGHDLPSILDPE